MVHKFQAESWGNGTIHFIHFPSLRDHNIALLVFLIFWNKVGFFQIFVQFLVVYHGKAGSTAERTNQEYSFSPAILDFFTILQRQKGLKTFELGFRRFFLLVSTNCLLLILCLPKKPILTILFKVTVYHIRSFLLSFYGIYHSPWLSLNFFACVISPLPLLCKFYKEKKLLIVLPCLLASWMATWNIGGSQQTFYEYEFE